MHKQLFKNAGLTGVQAEILDFLLEKGENRASTIGKEIKRPRGVVYKGLDELVALCLVEKLDNENRVSTFRPENPIRLEEFFDQKRKELKSQIQAYRQAFPELLSLYRLANKKPGVRFFEGKEGIAKVLDDTLGSKTEIYTFADLEAVEKNLKEINEDYSKRRQRKGIKKRLIVADTPKNKRFFVNFDEKLTKVRFLKKDFYPFKTGMQIYDNKISYQTLEKENKIAVLIEDENIYQMHKLFFEYIWKSLSNTKHQ